MSRDFEVANNWQNNVQIERQLSDRFAASIGASYARGYNLPVISNINLINPIGRLADGRPIYSTAVNASTRRDPRYNVINQIESIGESTYKNLTLQLTGRNVYGMQFDFAYTLGKSEDNAPITTLLSVQGDAGRTNPDEPGLRPGPQRPRPAPHLLGQHRRPAATSTAATASPATLVNGTIVGLAMQFASGIPINLRSNTGELNGDGIGSDRPVGVTAQLAQPAGALQRRPAPVAAGAASAARVALEVIAEVKNLFNTVQWSGVSNAAIAVVPRDRSAASARCRPAATSSRRRRLRTAPAADRPAVPVLTRRHADRERLQRATAPWGLSLCTPPPSRGPGLGTRGPDLRGHAGRGAGRLPEGP